MDGLASLVVLTISLFWIMQNPPMFADTPDTHKLLPKTEVIISIENLQTGFNNDLWKISTSQNEYILRKPKAAISNDHFQQRLQTYQEAHKEGIGPNVISHSTEDQAILFSYIPKASWPSPAADMKPYCQAMQALKVFHSKMSKGKMHNRYEPFQTIQNNVEACDQRELPEQFHQAMKKLKMLEGMLTPWLQKNACLTHGDFHRDNILISEKNPLIIDLDNAGLGHPYIDIAQFSVALTDDQIMQLFHAYTDTDDCSAEARQQFAAMQLTFLMVVASNRFKLAHENKYPDEITLSKSDMEEILRSEEPLPSFLSISYADKSAIARQKGALYALHAFLRQIKL